MHCHIDRPIVTMRTALAFLCIMTVGMCATTLAQDKGQPAEYGRSAAPPTFSGPLTLSRTFVDTENNALSLSTTAAVAYGAKAVTCPAAHAAGCTIKIETSSQFWAIASGAVAQESISVTGGLTVNPSSFVNVDATDIGSLASVHTFQWTIGSVPAGTAHTINISFDVNSGTAFAGYRTATIQLFLN